jgi:3-isopropylmalate/(R)-2-methylmalate dehydratase large subunit
MAKNTLYNKVWDLHKVATLPNGQDQLFIGLHLVHEVTTPQAFAAIRESGGTVAFPERTFSTEDHIIPTDNQMHPYADPQAELMSSTLAKNVKDFNIPFFGIESGKQGIVHVIGPELGLTRPGMTVACGDSHTSTHGAFGSLAFGIGTSQVGLVLETQTLALNPFKVRRINFNGKLTNGLTPKDVVLKIIQELGVNGGIGYAYEFGGDVFDAMSMEGRLTVCNMSIEAGARIGYVNPDQTTFDYIEGREFAPKGEEWESSLTYWKSIASGEDAEYDDIVNFHTDALSPMVTWGVTPAQSVGVNDTLPEPKTLPKAEQQVAEEAYDYMKFTPGSTIKDTPINVAFIGSCTNSRIEDMREAARILDGQKVNPDVTALVVPGSQQVKLQAEQEGLDVIFKASGAEWREAGCSMCLAMNPDKLIGDQVCASTSNRNFMGRQGSTTGRTLLMSPAMAAAAAITGKVTDVREMLS